MKLLKHLNFLKILVLSFLASICLSASASLTNPESGKEYQVLAQSQPTDSIGKVEVTEFFFYTCPHCNVIDPYITAWVKKQGSAISFKRIPVDFGPGQDVLKRMYFTLEAMGKLDELHARIFKAIHNDRQQLNTEKQILNFLKRNAIDEKKYLDVSASFGIANKMKRAQSMQADYKIDSVPTLFVDGRYMTSPALVIGANSTLTEAESAQGLLQVLDALVSKAEKNRKDTSTTKLAKDQIFKK
ncbi:MAG: thiol:disulfide interchange protein DsbA [Solimicrobium sp.]|jgi:thiol:disulfide interchange protein DsbA|nr:thiol:disulfide interchange protein DsbA [Solimicrobium sp.]